LSVNPLFAILEQTPIIVPVLIEVFIANLLWSPITQPQNWLPVFTSLFGK
jgi:hypothetical protein